MGSALGQLKILHHENDIRPLDGRQMVGDDDAGFAFHQAAKRLENRLFRLGVQA